MFTSVGPEFGIRIKTRVVCVILSLKKPRRQIRVIVRIVQMFKHVQNLGEYVFLSSDVTMYLLGHTSLVLGVMANFLSVVTYSVISSYERLSCMSTQFTVVVGASFCHYEWGGGGARWHSEVTCEVSGSNPRPYVGKLVVSYRWYAAYST